MKTYTDLHGIETTINSKEDAHNYAHNEAQKTALSLGEEVSNIEMNGDSVEIYGIENEDNLNNVENAFYNALEEANKSL